MSDFGSEMNSSGLSLMGKLLDALMKLIAKIYDTIKERTSAEYRLKKAQLRDVKDKAAEQKFIEGIEGKTGYVNHNDLVRAGVPLTAVGITLDDAGFKELAARCKREGIVISGVEDIRERSLNGNKNMIVECKQSDLKRLATLIDLMNDEKKIGKINEEITKLEIKNVELSSELYELKGKGEPTQDDIQRMADISSEIEENNAVIAELKSQIDDVRHGHSKALNEEQAFGVTEQAVNGETLRGVTFNEAVDRWTGGGLDKDTTCYVVDAKDPDKYIVCSAKNDNFRGQDYIKTTYEVYNGSKQVYATNDARFEGRPKDYWTREKANMRDAGGFGDLVIKFYSIKELEAYRDNYKAQNASELDGLNVGKEGRDYDSIIASLEKKIDECGGAYKDGVVVDKETGKPMTLTDGMNRETRSLVAEAVVMGKQIDNYKEIQQLESDVAIARTGVLTTDIGTPDHETAKTEFEAVEGKYKAALVTEVTLVDERKGVNAMQAEQNAYTSPIASIELLPEDKANIAALEAKIADAEKSNYEYGHEIEYSEHPPAKEKMKEELKGREAEVSAMRADLEALKAKAVTNAQSYEKPDDRRDDRVAEIDDTRQSMAEYKGNIEDRKKADGAKGNDIKDRETANEAVKGKPAPTTKDDR